MTDPTTVEPRYFRLTRPAQLTCIEDRSLLQVYRAVLVPLRHMFEFQVWRRVRHEQLLELDPQTRRWRL